MRRIVSILGGDGSLGTTVKFLRTSAVVESAMERGDLYFNPLPYGTGNDGAQIMGWGSTPTNESWHTDLESLMRDIVSSQT